MPQAIQIGKSVFQVDDGALGSAIDQQLSKYDSLVNEYAEIKLRLDAAEAAKESIANELSTAKASLTKADEAKIEADAQLAAFQTKLDAVTAKNKEWEEKVNSKKPDEDIEEDLDVEGKKKKKPKFDSDEVKSYCKEFLSVVSEVTPALRKVDSAFEPDFGLSPIEYKAQYLKTIETLPAEAKTRIDSEGADRDTFVEHLYLALKPQVQTAPTTKADEGTQTLADAIDKNRSLTIDSGKSPSGVTPKEDSPTMKARKERALPSAYRK